MHDRILINSAAALASGLEQLLEIDPRLRRVNDLVGGSGWTRNGIIAGDSGPLRRRPGFPSLLRIIVEQQLSVASANAIWARLETSVVPLTPDTLLRADDAALRAVGLSGQKILYAKGLARDVAEGRLDLAAIHDLPVEHATSELVSVKGVGRWTAEIYLMFVVGRPDVWPAGDLVLQNAVRDLFALSARPREKEMDALAEAWRPWRSVAARLFWHYYEAVRSGG